MSQCHVERGDRGGVRLIGCEPEADASARSCRACDGVARVRSSWTRRLVHVPVGQRSTHLLVRVRRYECRRCGRRWTDDLARAVPEADAMTDAAAWRAVAEVVLRSKSVLACARDPACSWDMVNDAVLSRGLGHLVGDERRFDGARMLGVDEHVWRHAPRGGRYVTVAVNPTPRRDGRPARLLDMVEGRSGRAFADWLAARPESFRDNVQVVAMDAFAGYKRAAARQAPRAAEVLDPFHVVQLAGQKLTKVRCRLRRETAGRRAPGPTRSTGAGGYC